MTNKYKIRNYPAFVLMRTATNKGDIGMSEYIIKNCPSYREKLLSYDFSTNTSKVTDKDVCIGSISSSNYHCQDCTDCLLKQIYESCKTASEFCKVCSKEAIYQVDCIECTKGGRAELGAEILKLLDIQEVE